MHDIEFKYDLEKIRLEKIRDEDKKIETKECHVFRARCVKCFKGKIMALDAELILDYNLVSEIQGRLNECLNMESKCDR